MGNSALDNFKKDVDEIRRKLSEWESKKIYDQLNNKEKEEALRYIESIIDQLKIDSQALGINNSLFEQMQRSVNEIEKFTSSFTAMMTSFRESNKELADATEKVEEIVSNNNGQNVIEEIRTLFINGGPIQVKFDNLVQKEDLGIKGGNFDLKNLVKKSDLGVENESVDLKELATREEVKKLVPNLDDLVKTVDLDRLNQQVADFAKQNKAFDQTITKEVKAISQGVNIIPQEVKVEFVKGNEVAGRYETEIKLEGNKIGTFSPTGYYFFDNRIYIYDHLNSQISIDLSPQFHFLKVVKIKEDGYKLVFCNKGGQEYYKIPSNYRLISSENLKGTKNINFKKYYTENGSSPSFVVKMNSTSYPNSSQHGVDVYEIGNGEKKIGSLIDEFGYYDSQNKFHYSNNHINAQDHSYNFPSFTIHRGDTECSSHEMQGDTDNIDLASDEITCSLVEYVANYVNDVYI
ncbi:hypothetical protein [Candidatus Mesenet endosymbiont of Phosphuga atrata]|uniref:hypothetical protein n=1 Tax=Candidatus Mesenet endosymbiont of Phosphuga atrata TaxID=3066221 RepID=UPI0030CD35C4